MVVSVKVLPSPKCLFDPIQITVEGLSPLRKVTLRASLTGENGELFQSFAYYRAESNGELDLTCSSALAGNYSGVEPMGLLWSLESETPFKRLAKNVLTPFCVHVEVFKGHDITNQLVGKCINEQKFLGKGAKRTPVREGQLKATLFLPPESGPFPGLIDLYGTGRGLLEYRASLLASRGFVTLALTYLVFEDIPAFTDILELDYFGEAVEFLRKQQQIKTSPNCLFSVRVIRARNIASKDLFTASDCYVSLWLPTASDKKVKTKTIKKTDDAVWNETFYFRIQNEVKNILELTVYDDNSLTKDDPQFTVMFDVAQVRPGEAAYEIFSSKSEKQESLEVEFKMEKIPGPPEKLITNGVLVSREVCCLEVQVDKEENKKYLKENKNIVLTVDGSYEGTQKITADLDTFRFHCIKSWEPILKARLQCVSDTQENKDNSDDTLTIPLTLLAVGQKVKVGLPVEKGTKLELQVQVNDCSESLDVRLGYNLCEEEQDFLQKRKKVVASALKKVLQLRRDLHEHEIPVIAVMATGGSVRAMSAMYGHLLGLQKLNLLDCATYLTGTSGSTWTMTNLYKNTDWSQKTLEGPISLAKKQVMKCKMNVISMEHLKYYHEEMIKRAKEGHFSSFTELWSLVQEAFLHDEPEESKLSDQRKAVDQGQNPLPIYAILNVKAEQISTFKFREWVEFSPYEVGFQKYGAFIRSENFDSEFFMGRLVKKLPESRICFLEGIWTNVFTRNLLDSLYWSSNSDEFWDHWAKDMVDIARENNDSDDSSIVIKSSCSRSGNLCEIFNDILTTRLLLEESHNFLRGLEFYKDYLQQRRFIDWKDTVLDVSPNKLTPQEKHLCLIDVGYFINTSCPPLLKPERNVDVIISLDYSMSNIFQQLEMTYRYCKTQGIPFPKIELSEEDRKNPKECYVFSEAENPRAPIVLHFPLVNNTFKDYKEPGVKRSPLEMKDGDINLTNKNSPYYFTKLVYSAEDFDKLVNLSSYNILNNKDLILQAIQRAMAWKRTSMSGCLPTGSEVQSA